MTWGENILRPEHKSSNISKTSSGSRKWTENFWKSCLKLEKLKASSYFKEKKFLIKLYASKESFPKNRVSSSKLARKSKNKNRKSTKILKEGKEEKGSIELRWKDYKSRGVRLTEKVENRKRQFGFSKISLMAWKGRWRRWMMKESRVTDKSWRGT